MILVIDNYDSFVFNLARYLRQLGRETVVHRNDQIDLDSLMSEPPEAIVISPGPGRPAGAGDCLDVVRRFGHRVPILGICLGHQVIIEAMGGAICRANEPVHGRQSDVFHTQSPLFRELPSPFLAGRYHSLVADPAQLPAELTVTARIDDGTIMAVEHRTQPLVGVQFHPESILTEFGYQLLANFLDIAGLKSPRLNTPGWRRMTGSIHKHSARQCSVRSSRLTTQEQP